MYPVMVLHTFCFVAQVSFVYLFVCFRQGVLIYVYFRVVQLLGDQQFKVSMNSSAFYISLGLLAKLASHCPLTKQSN